MQNKNITQTKNLTWLSYKTKGLAWTIGFVAVSIIAPAILAHTPNNQWITGTIVNAVLFLSAWRLGVANSIFVATLPSSIALLRGLLPAPMAMMIPFIVISNIILISTSSYFDTINRHRVSVKTDTRCLFGVLIASLAKFAFLYLIVSIMAGKLNPVLVHMLTWPQLITALAGGLIAIGFIKALEKKKISKS